jgi:hypothetical protein
MPLVAPVITATLPSSRPMSFPHQSDAGFSITPACRNNASRAFDDWPMAIIAAAKRVFSAMLGLILDSLIG